MGDDSAATPTRGPTQILSQQRVGNIKADASRKQSKLKVLPMPRGTHVTLANKTNV